jgi:tRNA uridine 5-carbamoylmethylation protein Kti12
MSDLILSVIGAPCVGKGSVLEDVQKKMLEEARVALVSTSKFIKRILTPEDVEAMKNGGLFPREEPLREMLYDEVDNLFALGAEVVMIDGFPRWDDQLKWMVQNFVQPMSIVQIVAPNDFELAKRAAQRNRDEHDRGDAFIARLNRQRAEIAKMEPLISMYAIPYTTVINDYKERAVLEFIAKVKWPHREKGKEKRYAPR